MRYLGAITLSGRKHNHPTQPFSIFSAPIRALTFIGMVCLSIMGGVELQEGLASPQGESSDKLTLNYGLAIKDRPQESSSISGRTVGALKHQRARSLTHPHIHTQSSSTALQEESHSHTPLNENRQPITGQVSKFTINDVPSYIIHEPSHSEPSSSEQVATAPPAEASAPAEEPALEEQEAPVVSTSFPKAIPTTLHPRIAETFHPPPQLISSIEQPLEITDTPKLFSTNLSLAGFLEPSLIRFSKVFHPEWVDTKDDKLGSYGSIPLVLNAAVEKNLRYFQEGIPDRFQTYLDRFHHYREVVEPIFQEFGIPTELMYLSLVESGFNPRAYSRARASGPWQFMKATGRMYKLHVNWYVDERRDPIKSTVAAAHHLRDLYDHFGSWPLALAAYNAGSGKISRAIRKTGTRNFWKIRRTWYIRRETKEYVPRFIAATMIAQNPTAYGFQKPAGDRYAYEEALISKRVHFKEIAKRTGIDLEELKRLNPELRRNIVPSPKGSGYILKVPVGMAASVKTHHSSLQAWTQPPPPPTEWYRVRRGDSLSVVARRYGMKVRQLKAMNNLRSNVIRVGKRLRVRARDYEENGPITWYRVRYGDSLGSIARRFGTSVSRLKRLNNLSGHLIYPGNRLKVRGTEPAKRSKGTDSKWYRVRRGDSLWSIAQQFSISVRDLRRLNNLSSSIIRAGHMLMISQ